MADARAIRALMASWIISMEAENKSPRTVDNYTEAMRLFTRWLEDPDHDRPVDPDAITTELCRTWIVELISTRSASTARTRWNGLRHFFAWCLDEGETDSNPMAAVVAPALERKVVDMLDGDEFKQLLAACQGTRLVDRRDEALILTYADTGLRLSELALALVENLDLRAREVLVVGKGRKERVVPFGARTAKALDRYLRIRNRQPFAEGPWLWLSGKDGRALTPDAIKQMFRRRGQSVGIHVHAHMLRHGFADAWLSSGGSEGDLMELAGWESRQMLQRYGAKRRSERAREAYRGRSPMDNL
jgi:site-specific recombinase XerD